MKNDGRSDRKPLGPSLPIILSIICFAVGCSREKPHLGEVARPVKTIVIAGDEPNVRVFPGRVEASTMTPLAFRVSGLLVRLPVREGQRIAKGAVIAQLRQDEFQAQLQAAQGQLDQAQAALRALRLGERPEERLRREALARAAEAKLANAKADFDRFASLIQENAVSRSDFERAETMYRVAQEDHRAALQILNQSTIARKEDIEAQEAQVRVLKSRVVEANLQLKDATLRAPYDGVIAQRLVDQGQNIQAKEPVAQFQKVAGVDIAVDVPETVMIGGLRSADIAQMVAEFSSAPGVQVPVEIREIAQRADPVTQTFRVRAAMKSPSNVNLLPGMTATVRITFRRANLGNRILVPIAAILRDPVGEQIAWVIGPDHVVARRPVKLGEATGGQTEVVEGLQPGDRVVVAGVTFLREGMKVRDLGEAMEGD